MSAGQIPSIGAKRMKYVVFSIFQCTNCSEKTKKKFQQGDFVYKEAGSCKNCKKKTRITMIYSEPLKPK